MSDIDSKIAAAVRQTPEWVRRDLASLDAARRLRAEETMAAIVSSALAAQIA